MAITRGDVTDALLSLGIKEGSTVLVHADAIVAAQFPPMPKRQRLLLIAAIEAAIGSSGTLVFRRSATASRKAKRLTFSVRRAQSESSVSTS